MVDRIVISGATGSIGLALINECITEKIHVLALVNPGSTRISLIPRNGLIDIVECSLDQMESFLKDDTNISSQIKEKYKGATFIHLAWIATKGDEERSLLIPQAKNIEYAIEAVGLAERIGCNTFIGAGSQAEFGRTNKVINELTEAKPESPYGIAKLAAGCLTRYSCKEKGINHVWTRILSTYGPNSQPQTIVNYTIAELLNGRVPLLTRCEQIWDFIYVSDVARALIHILRYVDEKSESKKAGISEEYVIGFGKSNVLSEYIKVIRDMIDPKMEIAFGQREYTESTVMHLECDISKLKNETGFEINMSFEDGIRDTIEWIKGNKKHEKNKYTDSLL